MLPHPLNLKNKYFCQNFLISTAEWLMWSHGEYPLFTAAIIIDKFREQSGHGGTVGLSSQFLPSSVEFGKFI